MKKIYFVTSIQLTLMIFISQKSSGQYLWMNGTSSINQNGVYGTLGVYASANQPGGRWGSITWKDASGIFWFFGGEGYGATGGAGRTSDLWKYDPSVNQWMWVKGPSSIDNNGTYGTKGTAASGNNPGAREVADNWIDNSGNFWIFGGYGRPASGGNTYLNDLWKYDPSSNQWTWMSGDSTSSVKGVYGTKGTPASGNKPGARYHSVGTLDASGNLLLFSGSGYAQSNAIPGNMNDLWKYNISTNQWTWLSGDSTVNQNGVYGTKGVAASANKPGARVHSVSWTDGSGNFWIFSGSGRASTSTTGYLNDLFKYDMSTGYWAWMSGDNVVDQSGVYNDSCSATATNKPGGRYASVFWRDSSTGLFWLYGGKGRNAGSTVGELDDLWAYDISSGYWSWTRGSSININGVYGTLGVSDPANKPGGREHISGWNDATSLWLIGGLGYGATGGSGYLNDLWKLPFNSPCGGNPLPVGLINFKAALNKSGYAELQWATASEINIDYFSVERSYEPRTGFVKVGQVSGHGNSTVINNYSFDDKQNISGQLYYRFKSVNYDGVTVYISTTLKVNILNKNSALEISPNPNSTGELNLNLPAFAIKNLELTIINSEGQNVFTNKSLNQPHDERKVKFKLPELRNGIYNLKVIIDDSTFQQKFIINN